MKSVICSIVVIFLFNGCGASYYFAKNYEIGVIKESSIGDPMIAEESGIKDNAYNNVRSSFSMQLIYGGIAHGIAKISYREFGDNYARSAFSQELQYDINQSKVIVFRSIKVEVIEASNERIRFKVLEGGLRLESDGLTIVPKDTSSRTSESPKGWDIGINFHRREITMVYPGSPADKAGLRIGDLINSVDGMDLTGQDSSDSFIVGGKSGSIVHMSITRENIVMTFDIPRVRSADVPK